MLRVYVATGQLLGIKQNQHSMHVLNSLQNDRLYIN